MRKLLFTVGYKIDLMQTREVDLMQIDLSVRFEKLLFIVVYKIDFRFVEVNLRSI